MERLNAALHIINMIRENSRAITISPRAIPIYAASNVLQNLWWIARRRLGLLIFGNSLLKPSLLLLGLAIAAHLAIVWAVLSQQHLGPVNTSIPLGASFILMASAIYALGLRQSHAVQQVGDADLNLRELAEFVADVYWETDTRGIITKFGGRGAGSMMKDCNDIIGGHYLSLVELSSGEQSRMEEVLGTAQAYTDIQASIANAGGQRSTYSLSGTPRFDGAGNINGYIGVGTDISRRAIQEQKLKYMARHDCLTGLANRYGFTEKLDAVLNARDDQEGIAVYLLDVDGFKDINDTLGHDAGDSLLKQIASRIKTVTRGRDFAARIGGDEFVVIMSGVTNQNDASEIGWRLEHAMSKPFEIVGRSLEIGASIGAAIAPLHASEPERLLKCADIAMYAAKAAGKNHHIVFDPKLDADMLEADVD